MSKKNDNPVSVSLIEKIIINLYTPYDVYDICTTLPEEYRGSIKNVYKTVSKEKITDYIRLVNIKKRKGFVPENVIDTYAGSSPCGKLQTYAIMFNK